MTSVFKLSESRLKILVLGYIIRGPLAGMTWHHIQYLIGLNDLGHDVYYYEDSGDLHYCCYNPITGINNQDPEYGLDYLVQVFSRLDLKNTWCYHDAHRSRSYGNFKKAYNKSVSKFDIMINLSGSNVVRDWMLDIPIRIMIDTDPVFTQIRNIQDPERKELTSRHNRHFTFGENINLPTSKIPDDGFTWHTTRQPIVLKLWQNGSIPHNQRFTSIMQWKSYRPLEYNGIKYGLKSHSFVHYMDLPSKTSQRLEIALGSSNAPRKELREKHWELINPLDISKDPWQYQKYIQNSQAEFSIAKDAYVKTNSGWFSERSACYLASGRPVLAHETGFSKWIDTGLGLLSFKSSDEAIDAIKEINGNYEKQCNKAREIAIEYFNANPILNSLIENSMDGIRQ